MFLKKLKKTNKKSEEYYNWKGGKPKCLDCDKQLTNYITKRCRKCSGINRRKVKHCIGCNKVIKGHKTQDMKLDKNPNWKGGISFELYPIGWNNKLKEEIRKRDNYICQKCGKLEKENNQKLDIHHIDYDKENLSFNNLISLCNSCHKKTNGKRDYWTEYFKENINA